MRFAVLVPAPDDAPAGMADEGLVAQELAAMRAELVALRQQITEASGVDR